MSLVLDRNLVLAAGAGSGKTHALVTVALGLYAGAGGRQPLDPARVWAVTFTEKAAAELRQRITARALQIAKAGGALESIEGEEDLARMLGDRRPTATEWEQIARALQLAPVGTFHSLCGQLLRAFASEARLDPRFAILDDRQSRLLFQRARDEVLLDDLATEGPARRLVAELGGRRPVEAAIETIHAKLAEEGRDPRSLLESEVFDEPRAAAAFGDACGTLARWLDDVAACDHPRLDAIRSTLARERSRIGRCLPDEIERWYAPAAAVFSTSAGRGALPAAVKEIWGAARECWETVQKRWAARRQAAIGADLVDLLERIDARYTEEKHRAGGLDFADLIRRTRDLLRDDRAVRREAKRRISALLVDEFQDTNGVQLDLVRLLAEARDEEREVLPGASCADLPLERAIFCAVGDRKQSIYEFRGADVALFADLAARAREGRDGLRLEALTRSFRSRPGVVHFTNGLFAELLAPRERPYEIGWFAEEDPLTPHRQDGPAYEGRSAVQLLRGEPGLKADERRPEEARRVAAHVEALLASGLQVEEKKGKVVRPLVGADVAILLRTFTHAALYQEALAARGIPTLVVNGRGFYGAREVRDLGAFLLALCDPRDRFASVALYRSPLVDLSDDSLVLLESQHRLELVWHGEGCAADLPAAEAEKVSRIGRLVRRLGRELDRLGPAQLLRLAIDALELRPIWAASPGGEQRLANVEKLLRQLEEVAAGGALAAAEEILARADDDSDRESPADVSAFADDRAVRMMTVHASKGLEFPVVILPELASGKQPNDQAVLFDRRLGLAIKPIDPLGKRLADDHAQEVIAELGAREEAESRRLFYVAVTRARDLLVLCGEEGSRRSSGTWRALLDEAMPRVEEWVEILEPAEMPPPAAPAPSAPTIPAGADRAHVGEEALALVEQIRPIPPAPGHFVAAVTELAELLRCERRYFYKIVAGLEEHGGGGPLAGIAEADEADLPGIDRLARGQLAHRILECVDLADARRDPEAAAREVLLSEGLDPEQPEVATILADAVAFLRGPLGRRLASAPPNQIYRELPFALELEGASGSRLALRGQIDLLFIGDDGAVRLVDYKHASARGQAADAYGFQLRTYALAASRILPGELPLQVGIAWLRDRGEAPVLRTLERSELQAHERRLASLGDALGRARAEGQWRKLPSREGCGDCGFARRCWGSAV